MSLGRSVAVILLQLEEMPGKACCGQRGAVEADDFDGNFGRAFDVADLGGEIIGVAGSDTHAAEAFVANSQWSLGFRGDAHVVGIGVAEGRFGKDRHVALGKAGGNLEPSHHRIGEFKRAVLDHLGVKAAVGTQVDVLEEGTPHGGIDPGTGLIGAYCDSGRLAGRGTSGQSGKPPPAGAIRPGRIHERHQPAAGPRSTYSTGSSSTITT